MFETLEGDRIRLRKARNGDWKSMLENVWGDEAVYRWMLYAPTHTPEEAVLRFRRSMEYQKDHFAYFIALKETDEAIGLCAIKEAEPGRFEEQGICIGQRHQGKGYGKEILALLLGLAFHELGADLFYYDYFEENVKSRKLAEHFGFLPEETYEMTRPWDGAVKRIVSCILTREKWEGQQEEKEDGKM